MYKAIHFDGQKLRRGRDDLRGQDIVYQSPADQGYDALPFGDGDTAYLMWNTERQIVLHINASGAVDFAPDGNFRAWSWESEERNTAQVHCARIRLGDGMPSFGTSYLRRFEHRLDLEDGRVDLHSETPFDTWDVRAFASAGARVMAARVRCASSEAVEKRVTLEAWGSRSYFHFYEQVVDDSAVRLQDTEAGVEGDVAYVFRRLSGTVVVTCVKAVGAGYRVCLNNRHTAELVFAPSEGEAFTLLSTTLTAPKEEGLLAKAVERLTHAEKRLEHLEAENEADWHAFWERSFVRLKDTYLENLYHFHLYTLNCCGRGKYPVNALGGAWTWNADARNWGHFYHWNGQQTFWGLEQANHPELAQNYYDFRLGMLPHAQADAKACFGAEGAFFSDVCNLNGYQAIEPDTIRNLTVGPQIALDLYRHYQFTCDRAFLKEKAYPFMQACLGFYKSLLKKEDGVYHLSGGASPYESYWNLKDTTTDRCTLLALLKAVTEAEEQLGIDEADMDANREIAAHLFAMPLTTDVSESGGEMPVLSAGVKWDGQSVGLNEGVYPWSPFPASQLAAIFPAGTVGLKDLGTPLFDAARNTVRAILENEFYQTGEMTCSGHTPILQALARLGMKEEMLPALRRFAEKYQHFPNGFMHYLDRDAADFRPGFYRPRLLSGAETDTVWDKVHEKSDGRRVNLSKEAFLHMYYEPSANFMCGVNEMLLQSHDRIIRVFPAVEEGYTAMFTLLAQGHFLVTSEMAEGEVCYIAVESLSGGACRVQNSWACGVRILAGQEVLLETADETISFETQKGATYVLERQEYPVSMYYVCAVEPQAAPAVKKQGPAVLGKERCY